MNNTLLLTLLFILANQGCSPMRAQKSLKEAVLVFDNQVTIDENCLENDKFNACIFIKNPVFHKGSALDNQVNSTSELKELQTAGIHLVSQKSDALENINISVQSLHHKTAGEKNSGWKYLHSENEKNSFEQVLAYFWTTFATAEVEKNTGHYWAKGKLIKIFLEDTYSGYSPNTNSIHVARSDEKNALSLSPDILVHYVGLANLHHATGGQIQDLSNDLNHRDCQPDGEAVRKSFCCRTLNGCSKALASGAADYFVAMVFPQAPTVGETWNNRMDGMKNCGISRDLRENSNVAMGEAFSACSSKQLEGHPTVMGSIYASMWWQVREKAKSSSSTGSNDIDRLYQQHLVKLDGSDNFTSAFQKILLTERDLFGGKYITMFRDEFRRRGIDID